MEILNSSSLCPFGISLRLGSSSPADSRDPDGGWPLPHLWGATFLSHLSRGHPNLFNHSNVPLRRLYRPTRISYFHTGRIPPQETSLAIASSTWTPTENRLWNHARGIEQTGPRAVSVWLDRQWSWWMNDVSRRKALCFPAPDLSTQQLFSGLEIQFQALTGWCFQQPQIPKLMRWQQACAEIHYPQLEHRQIQNKMPQGKIKEKILIYLGLEPRTSWFVVRRPTICANRINMWFSEVMRMGMTYWAGRPVTVWCSEALK